VKLTIIGTGSMAKALANGLQDKFELEFVGRNKKVLQELGKEFNALVYPIDGFDMNDKNIILAVKPYALQSVAQLLKGEAKNLYSILASTSLQKLNNEIRAKKYIRVMPNVGAKYLKSTNLIVGDEALKEEVESIFGSIGSIFWLSSEKELDIATSVAGSGPALLALVAESMMDGLVKEGVKRADAMAITASLFEGFAPLIKDMHPALIKDSVMSPAGTTAAAYAQLEQDGVRGSFMEAIKKAYDVTKR